MASFENIPTKLDISVLVGKVWLQCSAMCYIDDYFDSAINNLDGRPFVLQHLHTCFNSSSSLLSFMCSLSLYLLSYNFKPVHNFYLH